MLRLQRSVKEKKGLAFRGRMHIALVPGVQVEPVEVVRSDKDKGRV